MNQTDIINYYLANPPFEITDAVKYTNMVQFVVDTTLIEMSENDAILDEHIFTTDPPVIENDDTVLFDLDTITNYMEMIALETYDNFASAAAIACNTCISMYHTAQGVTANTMQRAMESGSVIAFLSVKDSMHIIDEWYKTKVRKLVYKGSLIKLRPSTKYYMLYRRYKELAELRQTDLRVFKLLFEINLQLQIYQSDTFAAEGGLKGVSLSGLAVSFNVPDATLVVGKLKKEKSRILSSAAIDYDDIGII